jgi:ABC-2 type transport system permease protein
VGYLLFGGFTGATMYLAISTALTAAAAVLFRIWLKRRGVQVFEAL